MEEQATWPLQKADVLLQTDPFSCGYHALKNALFLLRKFHQPETAEKSKDSEQNVQSCSYHILLFFFLLMEFYPLSSV